MIQRPPQDWHIDYLRLRYTPEFDCVAFVQRVLLDQFDKRLEIPPRVLPETVRLTAMREGDIIQSIDRLGGLHLGVAVIVEGYGWMLHNSLKNRGVSLDQLMPAYLKLENIYRVL